MFKEVYKMTVKLLNKERAGSSTFEWTMLTPFTFAVVFVSLMIMLLLFSWASYGSLANNIATDLNFRQTGLERADTWIKNNPDATKVYNKQHELVLDTRSIVNMTSGGGAKVNAAYKNAVLYHLREYANQLNFPYTKLDNINVSIVRLNSSGNYELPDMNTVATTDSDRTSKHFSNSIVKIDIQYRFAPIDLMNNNFPIHWDGIPITASGYAVIT